MGSSCCSKPIAVIIKVGNFDAGIVGLDAVLHNVYNSGIKDEEQIKIDLLRWVRQFGNYISTSVESEYKDALLREYKKFVEKNEQRTRQGKL